MKIYLLLIFLLMPLASAGFFTPSIEDRVIITTSDLVRFTPYEDWNLSLNGIFDNITYNILYNETVKNNITFNIINPDNENVTLLVNDTNIFETNTTDEISLLFLPNHYEVVLLINESEVYSIQNITRNFTVEKSDIQPELLINNKFNQTEYFIFGEHRYLTFDVNTQFTNNYSLWFEGNNISMIENITFNPGYYNYTLNFTGNEIYNDFTELYKLKIVEESNYINIINPVPGRDERASQVLLRIEQGIYFDSCEVHINNQNYNMIKNGNIYDVHVTFPQSEQYTAIFTCHEDVTGMSFSNNITFTYWLESGQTPPGGVSGGTIIYTPELDDIVVEDIIIDNIQEIPVRSITDLFTTTFSTLSDGVDIPNLQMDNNRKFTVIRNRETLKTKNLYINNNINNIILLSLNSQMLFENGKTSITYQTDNNVLRVPLHIIAKDSFKDSIIIYLDDEEFVFKYEVEAVDSYLFTFSTTMLISISVLVFVSVILILYLVLNRIEKRNKKKKKGQTR